ncbi:MAG: pyridoxamine 5'-phosphate oxidase family protein [Nitrososphaeraceae archaeon]
MAKLPIVKEDGSPHVVPLWFVLDAEDNIIFGTATNSVKGKNISCDPSIPNNSIHGHSYLCYTSPKSRC